MYLIRIVMTAKACAMMQQISLLVHMETEYTVRLQTGHIDRQQHRFAAALLHKRNITVNRTAARQNSHRFNRFRFLLRGGLPYW